MRDQWLVPDAFGRTWRLWLPRGAESAGLPADQGRTVIESLVHDSMSAGRSRHDRLGVAITELLRELGAGRCAQEERNAREVARSLEWAVRSRRLRIERFIERPHVFMVDDTPDTMRETAPPASERPADTIDWVSVVISDEDGLPLPNIACRITTPGGEARDTSTDQEGRVMLRGIESGSCSIDLADIDAREWDAVA